jgi:AraC family transcriptional regulator
VRADSHLRLLPFLTIRGATAVSGPVNLGLDNTPKLIATRHLCGIARGTPKHKLRPTAENETREVRMFVDRAITEDFQTTSPASPSASDQQFHVVASSLARLLETATRELERDRGVVKASLVTAWRILQAEIERCSGANGSSSGGLAAWQVARVRAYIDSNLHRTIHIRDLSAIARRSPAHFSRQFKLAVGKSPHAYVVRRRLEKACHLMITSTTSLSEIALSVGFSDQAHLCRLFRRDFGQSPANWRRELGIPGEVIAGIGADKS